MATRLEDRTATEDRPVSSGDRGGNHVLARVALALNSTLELWKVLKLLAGVTLDASGADRCSVFLLEGPVLKPTAAIGRLKDDDLWAKFSSMGPVDLGDVPAGWDRLLEGRAVPVPEARESELIPPSWVERFELRSVVLVPLTAAGVPCGVLAVDYKQPRTFTEDELTLLETIGSYAGVAVRNAELYESTLRRSQLQEGLARAAAALVSPLDKDELAQRLASTYADLLGARLCAIGLVDDALAWIDVVAGGRADDRPARISVAEVPARIIESLRNQWGRRELMEFGDDPWIADVMGGREAGVSRYVLFPLKSDEHLRGGILLGLSSADPLDPEEVSAGEALAAIASSVFERAILLDKFERQLRHVETLHALGSALAEKADASTLVARLNQLLGEGPIEVAGLVFKDRVLARRLGGDDLTEAEKKAWVRGKEPVLLDGDTLSIPMNLGRRLVGALRLKPATLDPEELSFVEALASGIAEVANRGALRASIEEAERERAVAMERGRIASDLHDTAGQLYVAIGLLARREALQLPPDSPWGPKFRRLAELADGGKWEIDRAVQALAFFPAARRGLPSALRSLARSFQSDSGIQVLVEIAGSPVRLSARMEQALYRVAHEAFTNAWRHARCSVIRVELDFANGEVILRVADDGIGLDVATEQETTRIGIASMRRSIDEVGGTFKILSGKPRGTVVQARVRKEYR